MARTYATSDDLTAAQIDLPDGQDEQAWVAKASREVEMATLMDVYDVSPAGLPTEPEVIEAFRDAVVAQVRAWADAKISPFGGVLAQEQPVASQSVDGASVSYVVTRTPEEVKAAAENLSSDALDILRLAGLARNIPTIW